MHNFCPIAQEKQFAKLFSSFLKQESWGPESWASVNNKFLGYLWIDFQSAFSSKIGQMLKGEKPTFDKSTPGSVCCHLFSSIHVGFFRN